MKQETLEEIIERLFRHYPESSGYKKAALIGKEWQAERSYSEEEVKDIIGQTIEKFYKHRYTLTKAEMKEQWFEQFKKK
jgi:hypothetical protein